MQVVPPVFACHTTCCHSNNKSRLRHIEELNGLAIHGVTTGALQAKGRAKRRLTADQLTWTESDDKENNIKRPLHIPPTCRRTTCLSPASQQSPTEEEILDFIKSKTKNMDRTFKLLTIGDPGVGKTSLVQRYVHGYYTKDYKATLGDFQRSSRFRAWIQDQGFEEVPGKIIIIGDPGVGKTSFVRRYIDQKFTGKYKWTVGVDFALKLVKWSDNVTIKLQLWDIAGQERFTSMTRVYYRDAHACIIMFDLTQRSSFQNALKWKADLDSKCCQEDGSSVPCILLANKCDLSRREVNQDEIESFCREQNFIGWTEVSVKEGLMVEESMSFLLEDLMKRHAHVELDEEEVARATQTIHLRQKQAALEEEKKCSC